MSTFTKQTHPVIHTAAVIYAFIVSLVRRWRAQKRKQRSLQQLNRLDDFLLDDIGLTRENNEIVPIRVAPIARTQLYNAQQLQLRTRARSHKRERQRHLRRRVG